MIRELTEDLERLKRTRDVLSLKKSFDRLIMEYNEVLKNNIRLSNHINVLDGRLSSVEDDIILIRKGVK